MNIKESISEKYRKYLQLLVIGKNTYYACWGSDISDEYNDKWIIDSDKRIVVSIDVQKLLLFISNEKHCFDSKNSRKWAKGILSNDDLLAQEEKEISTAKLNFIRMRKITKRNYDKVFELFVTVGLIEDYAIQTSNKILLKLYSSHLVRQFKDVSMDVFVWKEEADFEKIANKTTKLVEILNKILLEFKSCLRIV